MGSLRVRDRFDAVEMPLKRTRKSQNARKRNLRLELAARNSAAIFMS